MSARRIPLRTVLILVISRLAKLAWAISNRVERQKSPLQRVSNEPSDLQTLEDCLSIISIVYRSSIMDLSQDRDDGRVGGLSLNTVV